MTQQPDMRPLSEEELAEQIRARDRFKIEISDNLSEIMFEAMDKECVPYLDFITYPDMVDIAVGMMHGLCKNQLMQIAQMNQEDAFMHIKERWILTTLEMLKSLKKLRWETMDKGGLEPPPGLDTDNANK